VLATLLALLVQSQPVVRGTVVDPSGAPIAGAEIRLEAPAAEAAAALTRADGTFELTLPGDRPGSLGVSCAGFVTWRTRLADLAPDDDLRVVLQPAGYSEAVLVTASRTDARPTDPVTPTSVLTSSDLALQNGALDDALRTVPGFSLFRRSSSRVANPTTQGAGLRGLSASGASRALVLADGVPLNDPFGGWVYWNRVPQVAIERIEVVRGSTSDLYGADALAGVVQVITAPPATGVRAAVDVASRATIRGSLLTGVRRRGWYALFTGESSRTDGTFVVAEPDRGAVDTPAGDDYGSAQFGVSYQGTSGWRVRAAGDLFSEDRRNGTPLQVNDTDFKQVRGEASWHGWGGNWRLAAHAGDQGYRQSFSAIASDRDSETLTTLQHVPSSHHGAAISWQRTIGRAFLLVGSDSRDVAATNEEQGFFPSGLPRPVTRVSGFARTTGVYGQLDAPIGERATLTLGLRGDVWNPHRRIGVEGGYGFLSPRVALVHRISSAVSVRGAFSSAFRPPTLNELYRAFRVGNVQTLANPGLRPEELVAVDGSVLVSASRASLRSTVFWSTLSHAVTNVTLTTTPTLTTRRRENVGAVHATGLEEEGEWRVRSWVNVTGMLALTRSRFADFAPLDELRVPQVPRWQTAVGARFIAPRGVTAAAQLRAFGDQYEDDRNTLVLRASAIVDLTATWAFNRRASAYVGVENLANTEYDVARTPVRNIGWPRTIHGGVRVYWY
jgi:outer membrane receptor protein involved in Fe transport